MPPCQKSSLCGLRDLNPTMAAIGRFCFQSFYVTALPCFRSFLVRSQTVVCLCPGADLWLVCSCSKSFLWTLCFCDVSCSISSFKSHFVSFFFPASCLAEGLPGTQEAEVGEPRVYPVSTLPPTLILSFLNFFSPIVSGLHQFMFFSALFPLSEGTVSSFSSL